MDGDAIGWVTALSLLALPLIAYPSAERRETGSPSLLASIATVTTLVLVALAWCWLVAFALTLENSDVTYGTARFLLALAAAVFAAFGVRFGLTKRDGATLP